MPKVYNKGVSAFGIYYTRGMLQATGWPRKQGFTKKEVINTMLFDNIVDQMINWGASLGAGRPKIALHVIAFMLKDKDWSGPDAPKVKWFIDEMEAEFQRRGLSLAESAPSALVNPAHMSKHFGSTLPVKVLDDSQIVEHLEQNFLSGLLYGLSHRREYEAWYQKELRDFDAELPTMQRAGLDIGRMPSLAENYEDSEQIVRNYAHDAQIKLPPIPQRLAVDAKELGVVLG